MERWNGKGETEVDTTRLKVYLRRRGLRVSWLEEVLGMGQGAVSARLHGSVEWRRGEMETVRRALGLTAREFLAVFFPGAE